MLINRFQLFVYREMMEDLYTLEMMVLLLSMMYIYTEVNSKYILQMFNIQLVIRKRRMPVMTKQL